MWKGCAYANTSRNALFTVQMAKRGMTGPDPVFEGRGGYFVAVTRKAFELPAFGGNGQPFRIMDCLIKRYPLGQYSQSVVHAALEARARLESLGKSLDTIEKIHVRTLHTAVEMMAGDRDKWTPANRETADHSMPYTAAVALKYGSIKVEYFEDPYLHDPELLALVARIECSVSEEANRREPEAMLCDFDLLLKDGSREEFRVEYHRGHPKNPMSDAEIEEKFRTLVSDQMPESQADDLLDFIWNIDQVDDIRKLFPLTLVRTYQRVRRPPAPHAARHGPPEPQGAQRSHWAIPFPMTSSRWSAVKPGQLVDEEVDQLGIGAGQPGEVASPEHAFCAKGTDHRVDDLLQHGEGIGFADMARQRGCLHGDIRMDGQRTERVDRLSDRSIPDAEVEAQMIDDDPHRRMFPRDVADQCSGGRGIDAHGQRQRVGAAPDPVRLSVAQLLERMIPAECQAYPGHARHAGPIVQRFDIERLFHFQPTA